MVVLAVLLALCGMARQIVGQETARGSRLRSVEKRQRGAGSLSSRRRAAAWRRTLWPKVRGTPVQGLGWHFLPPLTLLAALPSLH